MLQMKFAVLLRLIDCLSILGFINVFCNEHETEKKENIARETF